MNGHHNPDYTSDLEDQAFNLIFRLHDEGAGGRAELTAEIHRFKARSLAHAEALQRAQADWTLMGQAQSRPLRTAEALSLAWQRKAASVQDKPSQLVVPLLVLCCALMLLPTWQLWTFNSHPSNRLKPESLTQTQQQFATSFGEQAEHTLADGSVVVLNWSTELTVRFSDEHRQIFLTRGEAIFTVAKDPTRQFTVVAGDTQTKAVGTEFSVQRINAQNVAVAVAEGVVEVTLAVTGVPNSVQLKASQIVTAGNGALEPVRSQAPHEIGAWRHGRLVFNKRPLQEVLVELDRYTSYNIDLEYLVNRDVQVTGTYFIDQVDEALRSIIQLFDLQVEFVNRGQNTTALLRSAPPVRPLPGTPTP